MGIDRVDRAAYNGPVASDRHHRCSTLRRSEAGQPQPLQAFSRWTRLEVSAADDTRHDQRSLTMDPWSHTPAGLCAVPDAHLDYVGSSGTPTAASLNVKLPFSTTPCYSAIRSLARAASALLGPSPVLVTELCRFHGRVGSRRKAGAGTRNAGQFKAEGGQHADH
jgi:hypothetical protein